MTINLIDETKPIMEYPLTTFAENIKANGLHGAMMDIWEAYWFYWHQYSIDGKTNRCIKKGKNIYTQLKHVGFIEWFNDNQYIEIHLNELSDESIEILYNILVNYESMDAADDMIREWLNDN